MQRRKFLQTLGAGAAGSFLAPLTALGADEVRLVLLHTNDTHSRIDPFPMDGGRNEGMGGAARRATLVKQIRQQHQNVLLLDSGDIFQGTPYFNFFKGEIEFKTMSAMQYDVATLGNHDFDNGVNGLVSVLPHANFDFVSANYDISNPSLKPHVQPHIIKQVGPIKVGIFGLGIDFQSLVLPALHEGVVYNDPIPVAKQQVDALRNAGCHLVICLSHLGYRYRSDKVSDTDLAQLVPGIDFVFGGHTHSFLDAPDVYNNNMGSSVVNQVGFAGLRLGRADVVFKRSGEKERWYISEYPIDSRLDVA
ncbi:MAG: metallophosphatase [Bacteroidota bacterium]